MIVVQFVHKSVHVREIILSKPWLREGEQTCLHRLAHEQKCLFILVSNKDIIEFDL